MSLARLMVTVLVEVIGLAERVERFIELGIIILVYEAELAQLKYLTINYLL